MKKLLTIISCMAIFVLSMFVYFYFTDPYLFEKSEFRKGILELIDDWYGITSPSCILINLKRYKTDDETIENKKLEIEAKLRSSDGLELKFCENNPELIGKEIHVRGIRTSGESINQDGLNRSCFRVVSESK